jgi:hypothetical protein
MMGVSCDQRDLCKSLSTCEHRRSLAVTTSAAKPDCLGSVGGRHQRLHRQMAARAIVTGTQALGAPPLGSVQYRKQVPTVCTWDACEEVGAFEAGTCSTHTIQVHHFCWPLPWPRIGLLSPSIPKVTLAALAVILHQAPETSPWSHL